MRRHWRTVARSRRAEDPGASVREEAYREVDAASPVERIAADEGREAGLRGSYR